MLKFKAGETVRIKTNKELLHIKDFAGKVITILGGVENILRPEMNMYSISLDGSGYGCEYHAFEYQLERIEMNWKDRIVGEVKIIPDHILNMRWSYG